MPVDNCKGNGREAAVNDPQFLHGHAIRVRGIVQGVGFRPAVWRLAQRLQIVGSVWNDAAGVMIHAWGRPAAIAEFIQRLNSEAPPLARIDGVECTLLQRDTESIPDNFQIMSSRTGSMQTAVAADAATCPACLREIRDCNERRYRYAFTNCTHCGPRLSIIRALPYDRANTSMAGFDMCPACRREYLDPGDRRFHAQANACPDCGPVIALVDREGNTFAAEQGDTDAIAAAARLLVGGAVVAVKGIGGFHLACDAGNEQAVARLRQRKHRYDKPFAVMVRDMTMLRQYARAGELEQQLLESRAAPIVILPAQGKSLASGIAPDDDRLGLMLPYTPLHHCLLQDLQRPIVLTSGNRSDEPQCIDNRQARRRLAGICDYWLEHDRDIVNRLDDSVLRVVDGKPRMIRRARGYSPDAIAVAGDFAGAPPVLAMGGELKNTFCLLSRGEAIVSQHMGDLENPQVQGDYRSSLERYRRLFDMNPRQIAVDLHPDYLSTQLGQQLAEIESLTLHRVQHHHAHIAACMAEHGLPLDTEPVLGLAFDGLGYAGDGAFWGGEFLYCDYRQFTRLASFQDMPLPGGYQALLEPWRNTYAHLTRCFDWRQCSSQFADLDIIRFLHGKPLKTLDVMIDRKINSPLSSSCGRCFDAFAAALGICRDRISYEGQAAIALEALAAPLCHQQQAAYPVAILKDGDLWRLHWRPFWEALLTDLQQRVDRQLIAARIHCGVANAAAVMAARLCQSTGCKTVVLSGGVFQNALLLEQVSASLRDQGLLVLSPERLPANDGGISLGQAVIAAARSLA